MSDYVPNDPIHVKHQARRCSLNSALNRLINSAKQRKSKYEYLDLSILLGYWETQKGKCYHSGIPMAIGKGIDWQISLERLGRGTRECPGKYCKDNCVLVCLEFNGRNQISRTKLNQVKLLCPHNYPNVVVPPKPPRSSPGTKGYGQHGNSQKTHYDNTKNEFHSFMRKRASSSPKYELLSYKWMIEQFVKQKGRCFYSGMVLKHSVNSDWSISIERIDENPNIGHTPENCVLVCQEFNTGGTQWNREKIAYLRTFPLIQEETIVLGKRDRERQD